MKIHLFILIALPIIFSSISSPAFPAEDSLFLFSAYWQRNLQEVENETQFRRIDFSQDDRINQQDLLELFRLWEEREPVTTPTATWSPTPSATATPEPTTTPTPTEPPPEITVHLSNLPEETRPLTMIYIPPGSFLMGRYPGEQDSTPFEDPQHPVTLSKGFYIGKYVVTKAHWEAVLGTTPWMGRNNYITHPDSPAVFVSWSDTQLFIQAMNELGQGTFRLPSEAEWEYACRAGTTTRFYWGDDPDYTLIGDYSWYRHNAFDLGNIYAHVVGQKLPNPWGLYDMSGNVWEWCQDWWHDNYEGAPNDGSAWEIPAGSYRVFRGGWYKRIEQNRSAARNFNSLSPDYSYANLGFRLVREE